MENNNTSGGCGCITLIIFILIFTALGWGLPIPNGTLHIDIFPPAIRLEKVAE